MLYSVLHKIYWGLTPEITAENVLKRDFHADAPNEKWLTEFKYYDGSVVKKLYLSAILDLYDRRIVAYKIGESNNNELVFSTFDEAVALNPDAHPLFHSDRGFQYTSKAFHQKLVNAGMRQSMSRVGRCIDNGPMEGYWGIIKSEMYYLRKFTSKVELTEEIEAYIAYYNTKRYQFRLHCMTPMEYHKAYAAQNNCQNLPNDTAMNRQKIAVCTNCTDRFWLFRRFFCFLRCLLDRGRVTVRRWLHLIGKIYPVA